MNSRFWRVGYLSAHMTNTSLIRSSRSPEIQSGFQIREDSLWPNGRDEVSKRALYIAGNWVFINDRDDE